MECQGIGLWLVMNLVGDYGVWDATKDSKYKTRQQWRRLILIETLIINTKSRWPPTDSRISSRDQLQYQNDHSVTAGELFSVIFYVKPENV